MTRKTQMLGALLSATLVLVGLTQTTAACSRGGHMHDADKNFGKLNPHAPPELSKFAFLIGNFHCEARIKSADGQWQKFAATWEGRYVLDGYAIADEYRMTGSSGDLLVLGLNFRAYDAARKTWQIKWLNGLTGTWLDLGPEELGGVKVDGQSIIYSFKETVAGHAFTRATYTNISKDRFTWRGEKSEDRKTWSEFMVIEAYRSKQ
ncbi:MAG TPA: hypothetical protein VFI95_20365 [Terriglobales bacterium]|nr:hypothetical protein [Terriglobales bacterium]